MSRYNDDLYELIDGLFRGRSDNPAIKEWIMKVDEMYDYMLQSDKHIFRSLDNMYTPSFITLVLDNVDTIYDTTFEGNVTWERIVCTTAMFWGMYDRYRLSYQEFQQLMASFFNKSWIRIWISNHGGIYGMTLKDKPSYSDRIKRFADQYEALISTGVYVGMLVTLSAFYFYITSRLNRC